MNSERKVSVVISAAAAIIIIGASIAYAAVEDVDVLPVDATVENPNSQ